MFKLIIGVCLLAASTSSQSEVMTTDHHCQWLSAMVKSVATNKANGYTEEEVVINTIEQRIPLDLRDITWYWIALIYNESTGLSKLKPEFLANSVYRECMNMVANPVGKPNIDPTDETSTMIDI